MSAIPNLNSKVVLITGAASGIGLSCAQSFAKKGAHVIITDLNEAALEGARQMVLAAGALSCQTYVCDVSNEASVNACAAQVQTDVGALDVLVNNAGISFLGGFMETSPEMWQRVFQVNLMGIVLMCRTFLPAMKTVGGPRRIVNIGSLASFLGAPNITAYCSSKHAVLGLSDVLAMELAAEGSPVGITRVCPGIINTPLLAGKTVGTNITQRQLLQQQKYYRTHGCTPDVVAEGVVRAVERGDDYCFVGPKAKMGFWGTRLSRKLAHAMSVKESTQNGYLDSPK